MFRAYIRRCIRLARKFWNTDTDKMDAMYESDDDSPNAYDED